MQKPVVAALNGFALGGGFELALRCHAIVAMQDAWMQFPEITLGIVPGIGAMVVPYRRWPDAASVFHGMLRRAEKLDAREALRLGVITRLADDPCVLLEQAIAQVDALRGRVPRVAEGAVAIPPPGAPVLAAVDGLPLSASAIALMDNAIRAAAGAPSLADALEVGYRAFGECACAPAAREGIAAFRERRRPDFLRTG
jgi:enoyl-CoA hydratase/3-hydroxyacyl-CoA dehydrogenase